MTTTQIFTSESVTEGHPDKVADQISDAVLDAHLAQDPSSRVACEALVKGGDVVIAGEITSNANVDIEQIVRATIRGIGYGDPSEAFHADGVRIQQLISLQAAEISRGVAAAEDDPSQGGAGDQGLMFGYASGETPELMPLPILLAHRITRHLAEDRKHRDVHWLRPDGKAQVSVEYDGPRPVRLTTALVSAQHARTVRAAEVRSYVQDQLLPRALGDWHRSDIEVLVNPTGSFVEGGPSADAGLTGRKIIVDTYGGLARHGGGAFSGKDPSKVDRSGAYYCRHVARQLVMAGHASRAEVQVAYAIGRARPVSVYVSTFGTGDEGAAARWVLEPGRFDFRPGSIIRALDLARPIYRGACNYGHFGRSGLPWEGADQVA